MIIFLSLFSILMASAPMKQSEMEKFPPIEVSVSWQSTAPLRLGWLGGRTWTEPNKTNKMLKLKVDSPTGTATLYALFGEKVEPQTHVFKSGKHRLKLKTPKKVRQHWLWGTTPLSNCNMSFTGGPSSSHFNLKDYKGSKTKLISIYGNYLFSVDRINSLHFYSGIDPIKSISAPFVKVQDINIALRCRIYHGGNCEQLFRIPEKVPFKVSPFSIELENVQQSRCPV